MRRLPLALVVLLVALLAVAGCGGGSSSSGTTTAASTPAQTTATTTTTTTSGPCRTVPAPKPKPSEVHAKKPALTLDPGKTWTATVTTNCGTFTIALDVRRAPKTAASFAGLAEEHFYDGLTFHRIAPGFVIQGGDPLGTGNGGPAYRVVEPPPRTLQYIHGVVAMAKAGNEPSGASGSQFFVMLGSAGLPPEYALLGKVTKGLGVVDAIGALPLQTNDPSGAPPASPVVMQSVKIHGS